MDQALGSSAQHLGPKRLIQACLQVQGSFRPGRLTPDAHLEEALQSSLVQSADDQDFVKEAFTGVVRYRKFLKPVVDLLYARHSGSVLRGDRELYRLLSYLVLVRLEDLGFKQFRLLVLSQDAIRMVAFIPFISDPSTLTHCQGAWSTLLDHQYLQEYRQSQATWHPMMQDLTAELQRRIGLRADQQAKLQGGSAASNKKQGTVPKPFQLSVSLPRAPKAPGTPKTRYISAPVLGPGFDGSKVAEPAKQLHTECQPFTMHTMRRPTNLDKIKAEVEEEQSKLLTLRPIISKPPGTPPNAEVRLNAAAILREDAVYCKRQQLEAEAIRRFEQELRDTAAFDRWRADAMASDRAARAEEIRLRIIEMAEAQDAAIRARQAKIQEHLKLGHCVKAESLALEEERQKQKLALQAAYEAHAKQIKQDRALVDAAAAKLVEQRHEQAEAMRKQEAELEARVAQERAAEEARRREIILQLRAIEKVPRQRVVVFDPTETAPHGLLEEMSLVELQARLEQAKLQQKEEEEHQRGLIVRAKQERESMLQEKAQFIGRIRKLAHAQAQVRRAGLVQPTLQPAMKPGTALTSLPHAPKQQLAVSRRAGAFAPRPDNLQLADTMPEARVQAEAAHLPGHRVMAAPARLEIAQHKSLQNAMFRRLRKEHQARLLLSDAQSKLSNQWQ